MAKTKFVLTASPTFKAKVAIPIPGGSPEIVEFTFRRRTKEAYLEWAKDMAEKDDVDLILEVASGWELEDPFDADSLEKLTQNYIGSGRAVLETYINQQTNAKLGN
jgi:hypothetical protein